MAPLVLSTPTLYTENAFRQHDMWAAYKGEFNRTYSAEEEQTRFGVFVENLKLIDERNAEDGPSVVHGITQFSDMTQGEFEFTMLMARPNEYKNAVPDDTPPLKEGEQAEQDWTGKYTTSVKDQGRCGSCWAFSAVEQIESDAMRTLGETKVLSTQQVISCDKRDGGCNGGNTETAYSYLEGSNGAVLASAYPDTSHSSGSTGSCKTGDLSDPVIKVKSYSKVSGESNMANYVGGTGPLSICVDARKWNSYKSGVFHNCGTSIDHCVQAVGINTGSGYWKVRNSWGASWGESGHIRLTYGSNTCGLTHDPTHVTVAKE
jgi:hypothetical protein